MRLFLPCLSAGFNSPEETMNDQLSLSELESRWENALKATRAAATRHPRTVREIRSLAAEIVSNPIDIDNYFPTIERLTRRLEVLAACGKGSIFQIFMDRISPSSIWQVKLFRMECRDLLDHLNAYDEWRRDQRHLRRVK